MTSDEFVRELSSITPMIQSLRGMGLSLSEAESARASSICQPRNVPFSLSSSNEILDLASRWDIGRIEIGMVRFAAMPSELKNRGIQIGHVEVDPLLISHGNSEIIVEEFGTDGHQLWKVAKTPGQFLDSMIVAAKYLNDRGIGLVDYDDQAAANLVANTCAQLAGGVEYTRFYLMLFGF